MKYACSRKLYAVQYFDFLRKAQLLDGKLSIAKVVRTRTLTRHHIAPCTYLCACRGRNFRRRLTRT